MKTKIIFLLLTLFCISCAKDDDAADNKIKLSSYSVNFLPGEEYVIEVFSKADKLGLLNEEQEIAMGYWKDNGKFIVVTGEGVGQTSIYIKDKYHPERDVEIKVTCNDFGGSYKVVGCNTEVYVQDSSIQEKIIAEVKTMGEINLGTVCLLDKETKRAVITFPEGNRYTVNYEWNKDFLTFRKDDVVDKHRFLRYSDINTDTIGIRTDLTDTYQLKYYDTHVSLVWFDLVLARTTELSH